MARVAALSYVTLGGDLEGWAEFAGLLGVQVDRSPERLRLRVDDRLTRLLVEPGAPGLTGLGWEVRHDGELDALRADLGKAGHTCVDLTDDELTARTVGAGFVVTDVPGPRTEIVAGALVGVEPLRSPTATHFVTGDQGLGHVLLLVPELDPLLTFYREELGFGLSDTEDPAPGVSARFLHCNPRHHSIALTTVPMPLPGPVGGHLMLETESLDHVGRALDRVTAHPGTELFAELGRHSNDLMTSFYVNSPAPGLSVEYGYGGLRIDPDTWVTTALVASDLWGHRQVADLAAAVDAVGTH